MELVFQPCHAYYYPSKLVPADKAFRSSARQLYFSQDRQRSMPIPGLKNLKRTYRQCWRFFWRCKFTLQQIRGRFE
jgi:hypothetical protein